MQGQKELQDISKDFHSLLKLHWYLAGSEVNTLSLYSSLCDSLFTLA